MERIFTKILEWFFLNVEMSRSIQSLKEEIITSTIKFYELVKTEKGLRPTPMKSHYVYNLRDVSKIFQGISKASEKSCSDTHGFIKLWAHECLRVFQDRLITNKDKKTLSVIIKQLIWKNFRVMWKDLVRIEPLL